MPDWLTFTVAKDIALGVIAFYGAILSTFNWLQSRKRDKRVIRVTLDSIFLDSYVSTDSPYIKLTATNAGQRVVSVTTLRLELPDRANVFPAMAVGHPMLRATSLPAALSDGQSAQTFISYRNLAETLIASGRRSTIKITPVCEDSLGNAYRGKPWDIDPYRFP